MHGHMICIMVNRVLETHTASLAALCQAAANMPGHCCMTSTLDTAHLVRRYEIVLPCMWLLPRGRQLICIHPVWLTGVLFSLSSSPFPPASCPLPLPLLILCPSSSPPPALPHPTSSPSPPCRHSPPPPPPPPLLPTSLHSSHPIAPRLRTCGISEGPGFHFMVAVQDTTKNQGRGIPGEQ